MSCQNVIRSSVNQQPFGGTHYPFAQETPFNCSILDLYLSYVDDICPLPPRPPLAGQPPTPASHGYKPSFYISTLEGINGTVENWEEIETLWEEWSTNWETGEGFNPDSLHVVIEDENAVVVFDTNGITPAVSLWGTDRFIFLWTDAERGTLQLVLRAVETTEVLTERLRIDPRTYNRIPARVTSLEGEAGVTELVAGYNTRIDVEPLTIVDGGRRRTRVVFNTIPGAGLGRFSDCSETLSPIRRIGGVAGDAAGNFLLDADGCFRIQRPVSLFEDDELGRIASYGNTDVPEAEAKHALEISSDCGPRCPDDYYVRVHRGILRMWDLWKEVAGDLEELRDSYGDIKARWDAQKSCRLAKPFKLVIAAERGCKVTIGGLFCNMTNTCLSNVELRYRVEVLDRSDPAVASGSPCAQATIKGSFTSGQEPYDIGGTWPQYVATFPFASAQDSSSVRFRLCIPGCTPTMSLRVTMTIHGPDNDLAENWPVLDPDGSAFGSDYPMRYQDIKVIPFNTVPPVFGCEC